MLLPSLNDRNYYFRSLKLEVVCLNMGYWRPEAFLQLIQDIVPLRADAQSPSWNLVFGMGVWTLNYPQGLGLIWSALSSSNKPTCTSPKQFVLVPKGLYVKQSPYTCCCMLAEMGQVRGETQEGKQYFYLVSAVGGHVQCSTTWLRCGSLRNSDHQDSLSKP